ncbi:hypothetical protein A4X09_0g2761 [Tilletia walkeri]|uniref:Uncharacterized protein n=1 Tax=Tilletia walkeri TaxID=117179 RepID=A0A8X7N9D1_9BASI|nr:hypothetical protein A4X09_0g2761 [Tilletia walkeri]
MSTSIHASPSRPSLSIKQHSAPATTTTSNADLPPPSSTRTTSSKSLRHRLSFRRPKQQDEQLQIPTEPVPSLPLPPSPAAASSASPKDSRSLLSPLRKSFSRSRLSPSASAPASAATSPNASTSDLSLGSGAFTPRPSYSSASSPSSPSPSDSVSTPRPSDASPASPPAIRPRNRLRSLSFSRKRPTIDTSRQSLDQQTASPVAGSSTFSPSAEAPPVPVLSSAYMQFRSPTSSSKASASPHSTAAAQSPNGLYSSTPKSLKTPQPTHNVHSALTRRATEVSPPSSSLSTASSQSTSSFTSRSSSLSTVPSSYPVSPAISAVEHGLPNRKNTAASASPLASRTSSGPVQQVKPALERHASSSTASPVLRKTPTRKGTKDTKATDSPTNTLASLEPTHSLSASKSFKASFKRKVFGRSASSSTATEPPTPELVGDSSASTLDSADSSTSTPPPSQQSPLRAIDPILTGTGKLDFFDSIKNLPSEDGHGGARTALLAARNQKAATEKQQALTSSETSTASGVSNLRSAAAAAAAPLAPSPILLSPKKVVVPIRSLPPRKEEPDSFNTSSSSTAVSNHRRSAPSDGSLELGSDLLMAVMSVQAMDKDTDTTAASELDRSSTLDSFDSSNRYQGRPSMAQTMRTIPASLMDSPESLNMQLPPINAGGSAFRYGGLSPPRGPEPSLYSTRIGSGGGPASNSGHGSMHGHGSNRRLLTEAQMRDLDQQAALYAERVRKERKPMPVHRPGLFAVAVKDDEDSEDDYGVDEDEQELKSRQRAAKKASRLDAGQPAPGKGDRLTAVEKGSTPASMLLQVNIADSEPVSPTSGSILFPSTIMQGKMTRRSSEGKKEGRRAGSPWDVSSDEEEEEDNRPLRVRAPEPGLDLPAKRALYTCTLLKIHPHLAPHFLVPGNPTAQPLAAVALAAQRSDSDSPTPPTEVRFPRSTNAASFLAGHASTTSLTRGGLRIALGRAQVMRSLKRRKLPLVEEVEISWFQRKYGSELVAPDRIMAEMGRKPQASPEALMKSPVPSESSGVSAQVDAARNPMRSWVLRGRFAERMQDWKPSEGWGGEDVIEAQSVLAHFPVQSPDFRLVPKPPALLLSARVCVLAGVPKPTWTPPAPPPKRFRSRELGTSRNAGLSRTASSIGAPWLAPRVSVTPTASAPTSPSAESDSSSSMLAAPDAVRNRDSAMLTAGNGSRPHSSASIHSATSSPSTSPSTSDAVLMRHLKQSLPAALTQNVIAEEEVMQDSDEEDLPLAMLQVQRRDQQRRALEAQVRQRGMERRREEQDRRTLEKNKALLADARDRRAKGDVRASVLQAHDYGAGNASTAVLGPSEQQREVKGRGRQSSSETAPAPSLPRRSSFMDNGHSSIELDRRSSRLSPAHDVTPLRSASATNLRSSFINTQAPAAGGAKSDRRLSKMPGSSSFGNAYGTPVSAGGPSQNLLSPPAPASIRQRSPDRSSTMPTPAELGRGVSMASVTPMQQLQAGRSSVAGTPPGWSAGSQRMSMMQQGNGLPLATPPSPYGSMSHLGHGGPPPPSQSNSGSMAKLAQMTAHERMMAAMAYSGSASSHGHGMAPNSSPSGGFPLRSSASAHGHGGGGISPGQNMYMMNMHPQQMAMYYGAGAGNMQALQYQQAVAAGDMQPGLPFMSAQQQQQQQLLHPYQPQPLISLDARKLPASATVLRRSETFR